MCGIIGLILSDRSLHVSQGLVDALTVLQHRGQDAAGIVTAKDSHLHLRKHTGTVAEVFTQENVINLQGNMGIGHVRYPTAGGSCCAEAQPLYTSYPFGIAIAHNGNLTNSANLLSSMKHSFRHINTNSDSEILLNLFADTLQRQNLDKVSMEDLFCCTAELMKRCTGGYAVVFLINGIGLLAMRDPHGIRPLCFGSRVNPDGSVDHAVSSESVAIDALGPSFSLTRDVAPGEAVFISSVTGELSTRVVAKRVPFASCIFEYVYFARPDSILDGVQVYEARSRMGEKLARRVLALRGAQHGIDVVIPIPETSRTAALTCATLLGRPYREGFVKNRYIARTFIMPGQQMRRKTVRLKLNAIKSEFAGKTVLLIDDSIVRGTTSLELVQMARDAGASRVFFASAAPPVRFPNVYGIDIPTVTELVAHNRSVEEIRVVLGADWLVFNELEDIRAAVKECRPPQQMSAQWDFDASCFDGQYVTGGIDAQYLKNLEATRGAGRLGAVEKSDCSVSCSVSSSSDGVQTERAKDLEVRETKSGGVEAGCETLHNEN